MGRRPEQTFVQGRHTDGQQVHEKMLSITNHQGTQIETTMKYHLTPVKRLSSKRKMIILVKVCRKGNPWAPLQGMEIGAAIMENHMEIPPKTKNMIQQFHF